MRLRILASAHLILGSALACHAADDFYRRASVPDLSHESSSCVDDLRIGYWFMPLATNIDTRLNGATSYQKHGHLQSGSRTSLQWALPFTDLRNDGDGLLALELSNIRYHQDQSTTDPLIDLNAYALTLHVDLAWPIAGGGHMELGPFLGYGVSSVSAQHWNGLFCEFGGRLGAYWTFARHLQVGLDLRYLGTYARQDFAVGAASEEVVIKTKGGSAGVQFGYRF